LGIALCGFVACAVVGCGSTDPACPFSVLPVTSQGFLSSDWRDQIDELAASAPSDSVTIIVIFASGAEARGQVVNWVEETDAELEWVFQTFSGFGTHAPVGTLPALKEIDGISGIDWHTQGLAESQACF
jgi:hypothetical protein